MARPALIGAIDRALGTTPPAYNFDSFDTNTITLYTSSADTGSGGWSIGSGICTAVPSAGSQATLTRDSSSTTDGWVEIDITKANDAGLVMNWQDSSHYLVVTIDDASSDSGLANRIRLFSRTGGTFTQIGSTTAIAFTRGTPHTLRLARSGTAVSLSFDGSAVVSGTDSANNVAGTRGLRANGSGSNVSSIFTELRWSP